MDGQHLAQGGDLFVERGDQSDFGHSDRGERGLHRGGSA